MTIYFPPGHRAKFLYPDSDGKPMAENTLQFQYIVTIEGGLDALYADDPNIFVAGDLFWYPVEGEPTIVTAPDALVAFNRPKGYRGSYKQWEEENIPPHVVFEVRSPGNTIAEMQRKFEFYQRYGVREYYLYDPDRGDLEGWTRDGAILRPVPQMNGWISPLLKVRFELVDEELFLYRPDGRRFATYVELERQRTAAEKEAVEQRRLADEQKQLADEQKRLANEQRRQREETQTKLDRLAAQLRALGHEPQL